MFNLEGTGVALITPFTEDRLIDIPSLERIINHSIDGGVEYLVVLGTTAEVATLTSEEKSVVIQTVVTVNKGRLPLVLGVGGNDTNQLINYLKTQDLSAFEAILSVTPYYNKPTQEGLFLHYSELAKNSPLPLILYNVPGRTGINLLPKTVFRLAEAFDNIVGIKEAVGDLSQFYTLIKDKPAGFKVISGDDGLALATVLAGGSGVISVIAGGLPKEFSEMVRLGLQHKIVEAYQIHYQMMDVIDMIFEEGNPAGIKNLMSHLGLNKDILRLPLASVSEELSNRIKLAIEV